MRVHAILNRNAGTMIGLGPEQLEKKLGNAFAKAGHCISVETAEPGDIAERLQSAAGKDYDAIISAAATDRLTLPRQRCSDGIWRLGFCRSAR